MKPVTPTCETPDTGPWLPTLIYPDTYRVTERGDLCSVERDVEDAHGRTRHYRARPLKHWFHAAGYPMVTLSGGRKGERRTVSVHVLVKEAFDGPTPDGQEILHDDGDAANCRLSNLVFGSSTQNKADIIRHGRNYWLNRPCCDYGHLLDGDNLVRVGNRRRCVACTWAHGRVGDFRANADRRYREITGLEPVAYQRQASSRLARRAPRPSNPIPDLPGERWLPVVAWEDIYMVSNLARVKGLDRYVPWRGSDDRFVPGRLLSPTPDRNGYPTVGLSDRTRKSGGRTTLVHLLVARAFLGETADGKEVLHNDGDPGNAALSNLRFGSHAENGADMIRHGRTPRDRQGGACLWGHELVAPNLVERLLPKRTCLACTRAWAAENAARARGEVLDHQATSDAKYRVIMGREERPAPQRSDVCSRDHPLIPINLISSRKSPVCLACNRARSLARHHAKRGVILDVDALADQKFAEIAGLVAA